ncbi:MAG TPA: GPW/gp25 family protein [Gaiellaceae bacterium]
MSDIIGTGVSFPLRVDRLGGMAVSSGNNDVQEAIDIILGTAPGERPMRPEFGCGIHNYIFDTIDAYTLGKVQYEIRSALDRWEPRIEVVDLTPDLSRIDEGVLTIDITYSLVATNDIRNLVYPFYLIPQEPE